MSFTEYKTVEKEILDHLQTRALGWRYITHALIEPQIRNGKSAYRRRRSQGVPFAFIAGKSAGVSKRTYSQPKNLSPSRPCFGSM